MTSLKNTLVLVLAIGIIFVLFLDANAKGLRKCRFKKGACVDVPMKKKCGKIRIGRCEANGKTYSCKEISRFNAKTRCVCKKGLQHSDPVNDRAYISPYLCVDPETSQMIVAKTEHPYLVNRNIKWKTPKPKTVDFKVISFNKNMAPSDQVYNKGASQIVDEAHQPPSKHKEGSTKLIQDKHNAHATEEKSSTEQECNTTADASKRQCEISREMGELLPRQTTQNANISTPTVAPVEHKSVPENIPTKLTQDRQNVDATQEKFSTQQECKGKADASKKRHESAMETEEILPKQTKQNADIRNSTEEPVQHETVTEKIHEKREVNITEPLSESPAEELAPLTIRKQDTSCYGDSDDSDVGGILTVYSVNQVDVYFSGSANRNELNKDTDLTTYRNKREEENEDDENYFCHILATDD